MIPQHLADEKKLVLNLRRGDHIAFQTLYHFYSTFIYARLKALMHQQEWVEEIHQDVFLKIWEHRAGLNAEIPFKAILLRTAKSLSIDFYRKALRDKNMYNQLLDMASEYYESSIFEVDSSSMNEALFKAIEKLPPKRKQVFSLIKMEGKKYEDVAISLGISLSTVKDHMAKAMASLRIEMDKQYQILFVLGFISELDRASLDIFI